MLRLPLSERQRLIVRLIEQGYDARDDISEELGISRNTVRREIAVLCSRYGVSAQDLPTAIEQEEARAFKG
jgi:DNA-binding NarL/FixJ family response regulator